MKRSFLMESLNRSALPRVGSPARKRIRALPAVLALVGVTVAFLSSIFGIGSPDFDEMDAASALALEKRCFKEAELWATRALREKPDNLRCRMRLIQAESGLGELEPLAEQLNLAAPLDHAVYGPAHLLRAQMIWAGNSRNEEACRAVRQCLKLALESRTPANDSPVDHDLVHLLGAELAAHQGDWHGVLKEVGEILNPGYGAETLKAFACWNLGFDTVALPSAERALEMVGKSTSGDSAKDRMNRLGVEAIGSLVKGGPTAAFETLSSSEMNTEDPRVKACFIDILGRITQSYRSGLRRNPNLWLEAFARILDLSPADPELTREWIAGVVEWKSMPGFMERLRERFSTTRLAGFRELIRGMEEVGMGHADAAMACFERAHSLNSENAIVENNYAALLGTRPVASDTARARAMIDGVLRTYPKDPDFLDTKGRIELRSGKNGEAVRCFEASLRLRPNASTHLALAEAYARMGNKTKASEHRAAVAEIR